MEPGNVVNNNGVHAEVIKVRMRWHCGDAGCICKNEVGRASNNLDRTMEEGLGDVVALGYMTEKRA